MTPRRTLGCFAFVAITTFISPAQDSPKGGRIEGEIRNSSGSPVSGATVRLGRLTGITNQEPSGVSGADGHFVIENLPEGREYTLFVEAPGYESTTYNSSGIVGAETPLTIQNGSVIKVRIVLTSAGTVSGKVVDADGNPAPRMIVTALQASRGQYGFMPTSGTMVNAQGDFRLSKLSED